MLLLLFVVIGMSATVGYQLFLYSDSSHTEFARQALPGPRVGG